MLTLMILSTYRLADDLHLSVSMNKSILNKRSNDTRLSLLITLYDKDLINFGEGFFSEIVIDYDFTDDSNTKTEEVTCVLCMSRKL